MVGAVVSTLHVAVAGVGSRFPAVSVERTDTECSPSASESRERGEMHGENAAPSTLHANVPAASELNGTVTERDDVIGLNVAITVSGATVSVVQVAFRTVVFPARSNAVAVNEWVPSASTRFRPPAAQRKGAPSSEHESWLIPDPTAGIGSAAASVRVMVD